MTCTVFVEGVEVEAHVGVYAHETKGPQPLIFDVEARLTTARPQALAETLDYDSIVGVVLDVVSRGHILLIEQAAADVGSRVLAMQGVDFVRVRVRKPRALGGAGTAGCEITLNA